MSRPVVDGQRGERASPLPMLNLRNVAPTPPRIAGLETIEVSMSMWLEADEWESTIPMDLTELRG